MKSCTVVAISGSPSAASKTALVAEHVLARLQGPTVCARHLRVRDLPPAALLQAATGDAAIAEAISLVDSADGIVVATPIYKAAYSGLFKAFLDLLPQFALAGKVILPCATGGSLAHVLALDYGLRPVLQSMGARHIVQSQFVPEGHMVLEDGALRITGPSQGPMDEAVHHFRCALGLAAPDRWLGHPRPERAVA